MRTFLFALSYKKRQKSVVVVAPDLESAIEYLEGKVEPDDDQSNKWIQKAPWEIGHAVDVGPATTSRRSFRLRL